MAITVKQLSGIFEDVNNGKFKHVNQIDKNILECNGLWIEKNFYGLEEYSVQYCGDDIMFNTFGDAVDFCRTAE